MIADAKYYYGAVITSIIDSTERGVFIDNLKDHGAGFYLIRNNLPLFIKYSTSRRGPWVFTFRKEHQHSQQQLFEKYGECLVALVCARDGIAAFSHSDFRTILDHNFEEQEAIRISRKLNEMYRITGRDGNYDRPVSRKSLLDLVSKSGIINLPE